jgi:hypothetical protein
MNHENWYSAPTVAIIIIIIIMPTTGKRTVYKERKRYEQCVCTTALTISMETGGKITEGTLA